MESAPLASLRKGSYTLFQLVITINQKNVSRLSRSYQTHSHNIHFKMTGLVRRFSRRRNMSSSRIHCCYIIIGSEFKGKHFLEQDELLCCAIISSGLKERSVCPFLLLDNSRPLSTPQKPHISFSSWGTPDFLLICLG